MPVMSFPRDSFFDPAYVMPGCLEPGTVPWLLGHHREELFPPWLLRQWRGESHLGRPAWPAPVLMTLIVLRWCEGGMSRLGNAKRAKSDVRWRAAMGLEIGGNTPSEKTLRDFEAYLCARHPDCDMPRYLVFFEHCVRLCQDSGVASQGPIWAMDSTPMWCYGAVKDTVRLLGDGVASLARDWSKLTGTSLQELAQCWQLPHLLGKSTKGACHIDWRDKEARARLLDGLAQGVLAAVAAVRGGIERVASSKRKRLLRRCRHLVRVIAQDLETDDNGRLVVAHKVAKDRLISMTDPQARHGHKSRKRSFDGFKVHVLGDVMSGLILSLTVTPGNLHDGAVAHRLIRRAKRQVHELDRVLGDCAYGGAQLRHDVHAQLGVQIVAPALRPTAAGDELGRDAVHIDFEAQRATCAAGVTVGEPLQVYSQEHERQTHVYRWPAQVCQQCPLRQPCNGDKMQGHRIRLHPYEQQLRQARTDWQQPQVRTEYRTRSQCERIVHLMVQHGGRQARACGLSAAHLQVHCIAAACNLALLAKALQQRAHTPVQLAAA
jgi:hypothetical protein